MSSETQPTSSMSTPTTKKEESSTPQTLDPGKSLSKINKGLTPNLVKTALDRFEDSIGGREILVDTIALATLDKKQAHFLRLLCDPQRQTNSLVTIARDAGISPTQVLDLFRQASFAKANALSMGHLSEALPNVIKDITDKSVDAKVECPRCFGEKEEAEGVACALCNGKGYVFRESDLDRQKIVLETTGILKKGPGVAVQVNQNVGISTPSNFFSKYVKQSDDAAYDVEGEVIDAGDKSVE